MPSQFFGLSIAYSGLLASNAAINTVGNNISNSDTEGYSRQKVKQEASDALRVFARYGSAGAGVDTIAIERMRDEFYDVKYRENNSGYGEHNIKSYYTKQFETYFSDLDTQKGFTTVFNLMKSAMAEVQKNTSDQSVKAHFVSTAVSLTQYFNGITANMESIQRSANDEIKVTVDAINTAASDIATLSKQINIVEISGGTANELRDKRSLIADQLSELIAVDIHETPITDSNNPQFRTGATRYVVKVGGGHLLVDGDRQNSLACRARSTTEKMLQTDINGLYDVHWVSNTADRSLGDKLDLQSASLGGKMMGLVNVRDGNNKEYFNGSVSAVDINGVPKTVTIDVKSDYLKDLDKSNLSDQGGIINIGNKEFYYTGWSYNYDSASNNYSYVFDIDDNAGDNRMDASVIGLDAKIGNPIAYQGVPYYMKQMNEWTRIFSRAFNDILLDGYGSNGTPGRILFTGEDKANSKQFDPNIRIYNTGQDVTIRDNDESYYRITSGNYSISEHLVKHSDLLATKSDITEGTSSYDIFSRLTNMLTDTTKASFRGGNTSEFLTAMLSDVALNSSTANTLDTNYKNMRNSIDNQRISISGVDEDDEALDLVKYQNSYNLASRMIQTMTEIYDRLILQTGV